MATKRSVDPRGRWEYTGEKSIESGQAVLYPVRDKKGEHVGLHLRKVLKDEGRAALFTREVKAMQLLQEAGCAVVPIVDHFEGEPKKSPPHYVVPYFSHGSLDGPLEARWFSADPSRAIGLIEDLYGVLRGVHTTAPFIAHRDLKPENVLIVGPPAVPSLVLCDFGLCKFLTGDTTQTEYDVQHGSRHYIAPEALGGAQAVTDQYALDAYALGKIAYFAICGRRLLGINLPDGERDLTRVIRDEPVFRVLNELVGGLVSHNVLTRMSAWQRVERSLELARQAMQGPIPADDIGARLVLIGGSVAVKEAAELGKRWEARHAYYRQVHDAFADEAMPRARPIIAETRNNLRGLLGSRTDGETPGIISADWAQEEDGPHPVFPSDSDRSGIRLYQVDVEGSGHAIRVVLDAQWGQGNDDTLHVCVSASWAHQGPAGLRRVEEPFVKQMSGALGDPTLLSEVRQYTREAMSWWVERALRCAEQITARTMGGS